MGRSSTRVRRQEVAVGGLATSRGTRWLVSYIVNAVAVGESAAARRANHRVLQVVANVREGDRVNGAFLVFQRPLLDRAINLAEVVDAGVLLCRSSGSDEVGDRDGSQ